MPSRLGGHMGPHPLRNADNIMIMGVPGLSGANKLKVELSTALYRAAIAILETCMTLGCLISIENPARSWLWALLAHLIKETGNSDLISWFGQLESVYFDGCAHGSSRDKRTKLLATPSLFASLALDCPKNHTHASWQPYKYELGVHFPTAAEAEYPKLLCDRMAQCVLTAATTMDVVPTISPRLKDLLKKGMGQQTIKHSPLIPEYKCYVHIAHEQSNEAYKLIAAPFQSGAEDTEQPGPREPGPREPPSKRPRNMFKYGVWHSPEEFLQRASQVQHPMDHDSVVHQITREAVRAVVDTNPTKLAKERLTTVFTILKLATELKGQDDSIKESMHQDVRRCLHNKKRGPLRTPLETTWVLGYGRC